MNVASLRRNYLICETPQQRPVTFHVANFHLQETGLHRGIHVRVYLYKRRERKQDLTASVSLVRLKLSDQILPVQEETTLAPYPGWKSLKLFPQLPRKDWTMFMPFQATM